MYKYLDHIKSIEDLKALEIEALPVLAFEVRDFLLKSVSETGGHLASNLGVIELTIALHYVFDSPSDKLIWDVGHQGYIHKILTGRKDDFATLRKYEGLSGFLKRSESEHDCFEAGHSSTSISAGIGFSKANKIQKDDAYVVSVIGDAALTGGMAYEALNYAGQTDENLIVILNDNKMAISENVGGMATYLAHLRLTKAYTGFKNAVSSIPIVGENMRKGFGKVRDVVKYTVLDNTFFEHLGYKHVGPIDGHDVIELVYVFNRIKEIKKPIFLHCITTKGKGYEFAEKNPELYHAVPSFNLDQLIQKKNSPVTFSQILGGKLTEMAEKDETILAMTAAMPTGAGLSGFAKRYPERFVDVGIAEQNAVTMAAGLASKGIKPYVCIYSTFLQRAYDQILHDVCLQNLPVKFCLDRAGIVGADGETHHGIYDISYLSHIPNMTLIAPKDGDELEVMLEHSLSFDKPLAIRYPRGKAVLISEVDKEDVKPISHEDYFAGEIIKEGSDGIIVAAGNMVQRAIELRALLLESGVNLTVVNPRMLFPVSKTLVEYVNTYSNIFTIEDHIITGGFGQILQNELLENNIMKKVNIFAFPATFVEHGDIGNLYKKYELDSKSLSIRVEKIVKGD